MGKEAKVCPFAFGPHLQNYKSRIGGNSMKCIGGDCMIWNEEEQDCNLNVIAKRLPALQTIVK